MDISKSRYWYQRLHEQLLNCKWDDRREIKNSFFLVIGFSVHKITLLTFDNMFAKPALRYIYIDYVLCLWTEICEFGTIY